MKNKMWKIFKSTGNIEAYMYYTNSSYKVKEQQIKSGESNKEKIIQGL
ncbi:YqzL family protein [Dethiothermospora halolimnae]